MNQFVNYQQRGIELPAGCKDLIDVLRIEHRRVSAPNRAPAEGLADLQRYVSLLMDSKAKLRRLTISFRHGRLPITLALSPFCTGYGPWLVSISVFVDPTKPAEEQAVRRVFDEAGIAPLIKSLVTGVGPVRALHYPLPSDACDAGRIVAEVLRSAFDVTEQAPLWFDYLERRTVSELI